MKEKRPLNPAEAFRRAEKKKAKKNKAGARRERVAQIPIDRRDPYRLISEIQKLNILDHEGKLTGDGRTLKKRLTDQFNALRTARLKAGLEAINLPPFDPDAYEANKQKARMGGGYNAILERMLEDVRRSRRAEDAMDPESGLPRLPPGEPPFADGVPGLPPYRTVREEPVVQTVFAAPAQLNRPKKDHTDRLVDDFLATL